MASKFVVVGLGIHPQNALNRGRHPASKTFYRYLTEEALPGSASRIKQTGKVQKKIYPYEQHQTAFEAVQ